MIARAKILCPRIRLSFGSDGIPLSAMSKIVNLTADALLDLGLAHCAAACTVTNEGHTLRLLNPDGCAVWSHELVIFAPHEDVCPRLRNGLCACGYR